MKDCDVSTPSSETKAALPRMCVGLILFGLAACGAEGGPDRPGVARSAALEAAELPETCDKFRRGQLARPHHAETRPAAPRRVHS